MITQRLPRAEICAVICGLGLVLSVQMPGQVAPRADALLDQASTVVLGQITSVSAQDTVQRAKGGFLGMVTTIKVMLQIKRCYKSEGGACAKTINFVYDWPTLGNFTRRLMVGDEAVVLVTDHDGTLTAEDPDGIWSLNGLIRLLGSSEQVSASHGGASLQDDISNALRSPDRDLRHAAFLYLRGFTTLQPQAAAEAKRIALTTSESIDDRLAALDLMLINPSPETVAIAARIAETEGKAINPSPVVTEIGLSLRNTSDPRCTPDLITILESSVGNWHYGAISGIRRIGGPGAVPALIKALDEQDTLTRYSAVITLFEITGRTDGAEYGPGLGPFEQDPEQYVGRWKQWWETRGKAKYGPATIQLSR